MQTEMRGLLLRQGGHADKAGFVGNTLPDPGEFLRLATTECPEPGPGQVLIGVRRAAVNPSDIAFVQGFYGQSRIQGRPAGFEGVGRVIDAGPGWMGRFLKGRDVGFYVAPDGSGSWADYAVTDAALALPLKKSIADRDAAGLIVNPVTAVAMLEMVRPGASFVFSAAASQLGKLVAALARDQGKRMIALVRRKEPVDMLKSLGAAHVLNEREGDFDEHLARVLQEEKPTVFLDAVAGRASASVHHAMGDGARWVIYGKLDVSPAEILDPSEMIFRGKTVEGFWTTDWARRTSFARKMRVFAEVQNRFLSGHWTTDVSAELPLDEALDRLPQSLSTPDGKVQIVMSER